jgi:DNA-binding NtrC family response regulator
MKALTAYDWPGNVRELENEVKRAAVLTSSRRIAFEDLSETIMEERLEQPEMSPVAESGSGKSKLH